jgi:4-amino-4-deoxy-L-arabinose transferase-like glycosyltransferase
VSDRPATAPRRDFAPLWIFLAAAVFFFIGTTQRDLWTTGEHRYAEVARVVTGKGEDHVVPYLNGSIYPDKPPLFFWAAGLGRSLLGLDVAVSARLPSILGGAFTVMLVFLLARRRYGAAAAYVAAGVLATTDLFDWASRYAHMDAFLTTVITSVFYCYVRADETPREDGRRRALWSALGYLAVGAGILVKGPPAPLIPGVAIATALVFTAPREMLTPNLAWGAVLAVLPGLAWAAAVLSDLGHDAGMHYLDGLVRGQAIAHAAGEIDKQQPWWFYLWNVPANLAPWALFLPAAVAAAIERSRPGEKRFDRLLAAWLLAPWIVFSFSPAKRNLYLLPIHPAAALLVARLVRDAADSPDVLLAPLVKWPRRAVAAAAVLAGAGVAVVSVLILTRADEPILSALLPAGDERAVLWHHNWALLRDELPSAALATAVVLAAGVACAGVAAWRTKSAARAAAGLIGACAGFHLLSAMVLAPARDSDESPRAFLEAARATVGDAPLARVGTDGGLQYAVNWVLERDEVREIWSVDRTGRPIPAETARRASEFLAAAPQGPRYLVTDADEMKHVGEMRGAVEILRMQRRRNPDLLLLGNPTAARQR